MSLGFAPPEAHLLLGRAMMGVGDFGDAEAAFETAIAARPTFAEAHRELAQLRWMRTGDRESASGVLDAAIAAHPADTALRAERARLVNAAGDEAEAAAEAARLL